MSYTLTLLMFSSGGIAVFLSSPEFGSVGSNSTAFSHETRAYSGVSA